MVKRVLHRRRDADAVHGAQHVEHGVGAGTSEADVEHSAKDRRRLQLLKELDREDCQSKNLMVRDFAEQAAAVLSKELDLASQDQE